VSGPSNAPVDVVAIMADLQQQVSDLTGVVEAQQSTLADLAAVVQAQAHALRQLLPDSPLLLGAPSVAPAPTGRSGGV
jgi:hypothetical protein